MYISFPDVWWSTHEDLSVGQQTRISRFAKRIRPWATQSGYYLIKANLASTGEFAGFALWYAANQPELYHGIKFPKQYAQYPGIAFPDTWVPCGFRVDLNSTDALDWKTQQGWSNEDLKEMHAHVNTETWSAEFRGSETVRLEEMGSRPHWYLAPLAVLEEYRGKGVGSALLYWGIQQAEAGETKLPIYLEAFPNARPVYLHAGFKSQEHKGKGREIVCCPS